MPSVTLGKAVAECFWAIAECPWHSAKRLYPVVLGIHCSAMCLNCYTILHCIYGTTRFRAHLVEIEIFIETFQIQILSRYVSDSELESLDRLAVDLESLQNHVFSVPHS